MFGFDKNTRVEWRDPSPRPRSALFPAWSQETERSYWRLVARISHGQVCPLMYQELDGRGEN